MLTFMLKNELTKLGKAPVAIEVEKKDFMYINDKELKSVASDDLAGELLKHRDASVILVDLNNSGNVILEII